MKLPVGLPPCVVVCGLDEGRAALAPGLPVTLLSAPGATSHAGVGFWRALTAAARGEHPGREIPDILDCGNAGGRALEALRAGQSLLVLAADCPVRAAVAERASMVGAVLFEAPPPAFRLPAVMGAWHRDRLLRWLEEGRPGALPLDPIKG